jgi:hypothetical protein
VSGLATHSPIKTDAPAAIEHVLDELAQYGGSRFGVEDLFQAGKDVGRVVSTYSAPPSRVENALHDPAPED